MLDGIYAEIEDVSFLYEGGMYPLVPVPVRMANGHSENYQGQTFQGFYAFRSDGATLLDVFDETIGVVGTLNHQTNTMLLDKLVIADQNVDQDEVHVNKRKRAIGVLNQPNSPERIFCFWFLRTIGDPAARAYEYQGWEDVDGQRCLRVELNEVTTARAGSRNRARIRFWIDLERGGHPLRVEYLRGDKLRGRTSNIKLKQFKTEDAKVVWMPDSGQNESFLKSAAQYSDTPIFRETYEVVNGTMEINHGLKDTQFAVDWNGPIPETERIRELRARFMKPRTPSNRIENVQASLEERLKRADEQAGRLIADSPNAEFAATTTVLQVIFGTIGVVLIIAVVVIKRRA
jgi:hypothetical protein